MGFVEFKGARDFIVQRRKDLRFDRLAIPRKKDLVFGTAMHPVKTGRGLMIGNGLVYPELNFTLSAVQINDNTLPQITEQYKSIITEAIERAIHLESNGVVFEFETLMEMTLKPEIGVELVKVMNDICEDYYQRKGFKSEIRLTPNDIRDFERPPKMRTSPYLANMLELFERGAESGGDLLSIESTGGKEVFDEAVMMCDIRQVMFSLIVLGVRDMRFLWEKIVAIAQSQNKIPAGDTACGFANTAMMLADKSYIPKVFASVVRIITIVRTLVALEMGATGPDKDCGYEGPFLKAITGTPISMEGKTAACAHLSPVGNVAAACADLWSNESVQNLKLLGGMAPTVYLEQLEYDVRLFNAAIRSGEEKVLDLQALLVESDIHYDPQALILAPESVIAISEEVVKGKTYLQAAINGSLKGLEIIEEAVKNKELKLEEREKAWINRIREELSTMPIQEDKFIESVLPMIEEGKFIPEEYGL